MRLLIKLLPILVLFSCATSKRCNEKFPPTSTVKDSIITKVEIKYKDTTLYLPGEEIKITEYLPCPDFQKEVKKGRITASVKIKKGVMTIDCAEDSLMTVNASLKQTLIEVNNNHIKESQKPPVKEFIVHWYDIMCRWISIIAMLCLVIWIAIKIP